MRKSEGGSSGLSTMRSGSRILRSTLLLQGLLLAADASAAPVRLDEAALRPPEWPGELGRAAVGRAVPVPAGAAPPTDLPRSAFPPVRRPTPAIAPEANRTQSQPLDDAHGTTGNPARAQADALRSQTDAIPAMPEPSVEGDIDPDLKEAARAAHQWVREAVPWPRQLNVGDAPYDLFKAGAEGLVKFLAPAVSGTGPDEAYPGDPQEPRTFRGAAQPNRINLVGEVLKFVKEVLGHPMSWLVIALMAIGKVAVSIASRRSSGTPRKRATLR